MYLSRSIVLNNSLLLDYLILESFSYCDFSFLYCSPPAYSSETNILGQCPLEDFVSLSSRSPSKLLLNTKKDFYLFYFYIFL